MNRRKVLLSSGIALTTALAGCSSDETGDENGSDNGEDDEAELSVVYNYRRFEKLTTPDNDDVFYESDEETQYVGAQVQVTNETDEEVSVNPDALYVLADGGVDDVTIHAQSKTDPLDSIEAGETVETWMFFTTPPDAELDFGTTQWATHSFDLTHDEDLELALEEYEE